MPCREAAVPSAHWVQEPTYLAQAGAIWKRALHVWALSPASLSRGVVSHWGMIQYH